MSKARHVKTNHKRQTPEEKAETDRLAELGESEADRADARRVRDRHERMRAIISELRAERERQGLSLAAMAERIGMDRQNLHRIETNPNANPTLETIHRLAEALGKQLHLELHDLGEAA